MSTVLAQDHFYSDFLSLFLTILTHKGSMMMIGIRCDVEMCLDFCHRRDEFLRIGCFEWIAFSIRDVRNNATQLLLAPSQRFGRAVASQRSLHNAPIFRLLLKVAVNGTHQCDYSNFCGDFGPQPFCERNAPLARERKLW